MKRRTIVPAVVFTMMSSLAFAQPAPIGSSATFGNGAVINRGPVWTVGEDMDFRTNRAYASGWSVRHRRAHRHIAHHWR